MAGGCRGLVLSVRGVLGMNKLSPLSLGLQRQETKGCRDLHAMARLCWSQTRSLSTSKGKGKARKEKGKVTMTAAVQLQKALLKEGDYLREESAALAAPKPPKGWRSVNVDDFVSRGDEGVIVMRKKFSDHRVDVVASTQLIEIASEDIGELDEDDPAETDSAAILVVLTKVGRGKPFILECLANAESGCTAVRMSVGIDSGVYLSSVYGPATSLYLTYSALWEHEVSTAGIEAGENVMDEDRLQLWHAAKQEMEDDPVCASFSEIHELEPAFQEILHDMVDSRVEPALIDYLMQALQHEQREQYIAFLEGSSKWIMT